MIAKLCILATTRVSVETKAEASTYLEEEKKKGEAFFIATISTSVTRTLHFVLMETSKQVNESPAKLATR